VSDKKNKMECWEDYYARLVNPLEQCLQTIELMVRISPLLLWSIQTLTALIMLIPPEGKAAKATGRLKGGKASGLCGITAER